MWSWVHAPEPKSACLDRHRQFAGVQQVDQPIAGGLVRRIVPQCPGQEDVRLPLTPGAELDRRLPEVGLRQRVRELCGVPCRHVPSNHRNDQEGGNRTDRDVADSGRCADASIPPDHSSHRGRDL